LEPRWQPTAFVFNTGIPDGRVATISEPPNAHNSQVEFESADDFVLPTHTVITHAAFTGLLTGGATLKDVSNVFITIYRVFPNDSDLTRIPNVPTRVNSPADNEIENRDSAAGELNFHAHVLSTSFTASDSVSSADKISVNSKGNGPATGEEVEFDVTFRNHPLDLPADDYFFVPKVGLSDQAPAAANFLWLSAPKPIVPPGTPFTPDRQSWMRDDPGLAPDWLRIGTDIIKEGAPPLFTPLNASFELSGHTAKSAAAHFAPDSAGNGSPDLTPPVASGTFTNQAALFNALLAAPAFGSARTLQATAPPAILPDGASASITIAGVQPLSRTGNVPVLSATPTQSDKLQIVTLPPKSEQSHGQGIVETALINEGIASAPWVFSTIF
jgi:hypothetical protein